MRFDEIRISFTIYKKDHLEIKAFCDSNGVTMKDFAVGLLREAIREKKHNCCSKCGTVKEN